MKIIIFTGHLVDALKREKPRFPASKVPLIQRKIYKELNHIIQDSRDVIAISSLGAGSDLLFAKEIVQRNIPLHAFLPFCEEDFLEISVNYTKSQESGALNLDWENEFHSLLSKARQVHITSEGGYLGNNQFQICNNKMMEFAMGFQKGIDTEIYTLALVNPDSAVVTGGASDFLEDLKSKKVIVRRFWLDETEDIKYDTEITYEGLKKLVPLFGWLDQIALTNQNKWRKSFRISLLIIGCIAFISTFDSMEGDYANNFYNTLRIIAITVAIVGALIELFFQTKDVSSQKKWIQYRAIAENIRSEIWFLLFGFRFENTEHIYTSAGWSAYLGNFKVVIPYSQNDVSTHEINPDLLKKIELYQFLNIDQKKSVFLKDRILDQLKYFDKKILSIHTQLKRFRFMRFMLLVSAVLWGILLILDMQFSFHEIFRDLNFIGCFVAFIAILTSLIESEGLDELVLVYKNIREGLIEFKDKIQGLNDEDEFKIFVRDVETLLRKQNDEWSFKRGFKFR